MQDAVFDKNKTGFSKAQITFDKSLFTGRELESMEPIAQGLSNREISQKLSKLNQRSFAMETTKPSYFLSRDRLMLLIFIALKLLISLSPFITAFFVTNSIISP